MERRHVLAVSIRSGLGEPQLAGVVRTAALPEELNALADELDDDRLALDPASAVACDPLVSGAADAPSHPRSPRMSCAGTFGRSAPASSAECARKPGDPGAGTAGRHSALA
jgi:hypothetical protein